MANSAEGLLTPVQLEIMQEVWSRTECTITELWQVLEQRRDVARNTVLTLVQRLEQRGWLRSEPRGRGRVYRAAVPRETVQHQHLQNVVEQVFEGSAEALVRSLLGHEMVSPEEIESLRQFLGKAKQKQRRRQKKEVR